MFFLVTCNSFPTEEDVHTYTYLLFNVSLNSTYTFGNDFWLGKHVDVKTMIGFSRLIVFFISKHLNHNLAVHKFFHLSTLNTYSTMYLLSGKLLSENICLKGLEGLKI